MSPLNAKSHILCLFPLKAGLLNFLRKRGGAPQENVGLTLKQQHRGDNLRSSGNVALKEDEKELNAGGYCQCVPGCLAQEPLGEPCYMFCRSSLSQIFQNQTLGKKV